MHNFLSASDSQVSVKDSQVVYSLCASDVCAVNVGVS